jgi:uncharacterized membrane protein YgaE (UPF0421/DUF939 family)
VHRLRNPVWWTDALQVVKTVVAAVVAWVLAAQVFDIPQAFLAPWAALLTVHATVYRTFRRGAQQIGATVLGVIVAFALGSLIGLNALSLGLTILIALVAGSIRGLRAESTTAAATALVVLTTGATEQASTLLERLGDTGIGIAVGLLVNLLVWPPLRDRSAAAHVDAIDDQLGELLCEMAAGLRAQPEAPGTEDWIERAGELEGDVDRAWGVVRQARESGRLNPRRVARDRMRRTEDFGDILDRLEQAIAEIRSMARTIHLGAAQDWDPQFRDAWLDLLERTGAAVSAAEPEQLAGLRENLDALAHELRNDHGFWPVAGALLVNLRNTIAALDVVAGAQPVEVPQPKVRSRL